MPVQTANLLSLADDVAEIVAKIRTATEAGGDKGHKVTLAELGAILLAGGKLVAHVGGMIASGQHG